MVAKVWFSRLDLHVFLGFDGLVQTLVVTAARQDTSGVFVDDEHFAASHHVVAVAQEQLLGLDGVVQVADQCGVVRFVQVVDAETILDLALMPGSRMPTTFFFSSTS